jgi:hypothetical protein
MNIVIKLLLIFVLGAFAAASGGFIFIFSLLFCWNEKILSFFLYLDRFVWQIETFIDTKLKL